MLDRKEERSIGELFSELASQTTTLVRQEVQLAKIELSQKAAQVGKEVGFIGLGGAVAYAGFMAVIAAVILVIGQFIPVWVSALIVGLVVMAIGYFLSQQHLNALKHLDATPQATVETLKQDKEWVKEQVR
ncbi:MAG TPA: phage holin family protein [Blastocatellia bacterium]|nr:phage holin family protein [Blastocatellia bacterium]